MHLKIFKTLEFAYFFRYNVCIVTKFRYSGGTQKMNFILATTSTTNNDGSSWSLIIMMVAMFAIMYFLMIRPQKKRQKEEEQMRNAVDVGDEITTIGGIIGRVVTVKEDSLIIETGADRNKMHIKKWSIQMNNTANERLAAEREAAKEAAEKAKEEKKNGKKSKKED